MKTDVIITYVNCEDPVWVDDYCKVTGSSITLLTNNKNRFRDLGTLRYLLRGIENNMPWINKVHLVVSGDSQVSDWVNRDTVNIVYHSDIIPVELLPVFNSCAIEMFLPLISDLAPQYVYFNDDMFPIKPIEESYWFKDNMVCTNFNLRPYNRGASSTTFFDNILNSSKLVTGIEIPFDFKHLPLGFITEEDIKFYNSHKENIINSVTKIRDAKNYNQYIYQINYIVNNNKAYLRQPVGKYYQLTLNFNELMNICNSIISQEFPLLCINDNFPLIVKNNILEERVRKLINAFEKIFPNKSKYEK